MAENPLKIITSEHQPSSSKKQALSSRTELQARMERAWLLDPLQFNPQRSNIERQRIENITAALSTIPNARGRAVDLGCGSGEISRRIRDLGWKVDAIDIASNALKALRATGCEGIQTNQDALPSTRLEDEVYDLVVCTEVIGYLDKREYRLFMAELSRLVTRDGFVIGSTAIDIYSEDALQRFNALAETEFTIKNWIFSHHLLLLKLQFFFDAPAKFAAASKNEEVRRKELGRRKGLSRWWYKINTLPRARHLWIPCQWVFSPFAQFFQQNKMIATLLENICSFFWDESGITHAIFIGQRRPLILPTLADLASREAKGKRQVWE